MGFINFKYLYIYLSIVTGEGGGGGGGTTPYFLFFVMYWHMFNKDTCIVGTLSLGHRSEIRCRISFSSTRRK